MWNFCFVCGCPGVRALQGIRIQSLIQHTVIRICIMNLLRSSKSDHGTETTFSPTHWGLYKVSVVSFFAMLNIFCTISLSDDKSSLVQTMAWCHQATNHYLIQYWPRSTSPYDVTRPRWARQKVDSVDKGLTIVNGYQIHISQIDEWVQINNGTNQSTSKQQMRIFPEPWTDSNMRLRMWLFCSISMQIYVSRVAD